MSFNFGMFKIMALVFRVCSFLVNIYFEVEFKCCIRTEVLSLANFVESNFFHVAP
jgi:hypothetical protein